MSSANVTFLFDEAVHPFILQLFLACCLVSLPSFISQLIVDQKGGDDGRPGGRRREENLKRFKKSIHE